MIKQEILDQLKEINSQYDDIGQLKVDDFLLTDIKSISPITYKGKKVNTVTRLVCLSGSGWVGSRKLYFKRYDIGDYIADRYITIENALLPMTKLDLFRILVSELNLNVEDDWIEGGNEFITQDDLETTLTMNNDNNWFFTGSATINIRTTSKTLDYLPENRLTFFKPLVDDDSTRIHLVPYSFNFAIRNSAVSGSDKLKRIASDADVAANLSLINSVISDLSGETWDNLTDPSDKRPGSLWKFVYNGAITNAMIEMIFGIDVIVPVNRIYTNFLVLDLPLPDNSESLYVGKICLYY